MKTTLLFTAACLLFLRSEVPLRAQFVQISYSGHASWGNPGANWFAPGELVFGETPVRIDVRFNPNLSAPPRDPGEVARLFHPEDDPANAADYTFRVRFGEIDLTRPISLLEVADNGSFSIESFGEGHELNVQIFLAPPPPDLPLPSRLPPIVTGSAGIVLGENLPRNPPPDYGILIVDIDHATLTPVPEPATYGLLAAALLGGAILLRRRAPQVTNS